MPQPVRTDCTITGEGPAVFLTHGVGSRHSVWEKVVRHLAPHFRCIAYDLRGHAGHAPADMSFGLDEFVADLEALRQQLGIEKAHFVGHSLGGMIVPAYAHAHSAHIKSVGLISTVAFRGDEAKAGMVNFVKKLDDGGTAAVVETLLDRWFTDDFRRKNQDIITARKAQVLELEPRVYREAYNVYATADVGPLLPKIKVPALVMTGEFDPSCGPALNKKMAEALPQGELIILPDLRHSLLIEAPDIVGRGLLKFLLSVEGSVKKSARCGRIHGGALVAPFSVSGVDPV